MNLCLSLSFIALVVCLPFQSAQPEDETKQDFSSIPGHLEPLGARSTKHPVEVIQSYPDPKAFFKTYVIASKPVLIQNAAKLSSAFTKWTDEYFLSLPESTDYKIEAEQRKKEKRTVPPEEISFSEFVKTYREQDIYMVNSVPQFIRKDVLLPSPLLCRDITDKEMLADAIMWFSNGGTKSVLHFDDGFDNINCLFRGTKELLFIDYDKYKHMVTIDFPAGGYSGVDVDRVDFEKYPGLSGVEFYNVTMQAGDCLYIPHRWFHQVRSYDRNIAVNLWWLHSPGFVPEDCDGLEPNQTLDKFKIKSVKEILEKKDDDMLARLDFYLGEKDEVCYKTFVRKLKQDPQLFNNENIHWTKDMKLTARKMFKLMDVDGDKYFSVDDMEEISQTGSLDGIANEFYRFFNLLEQDQKKGAGSGSQRNADDNKDIQSVEKGAKGKDRDEL